MNIDTLVVVTRVVFLTLFAIAVGTLWVVLVTRKIRLVPYAWIAAALALVGVVPFSFARAAQTDHRQAAIVRVLEERYGIEINDPQFTKSVTEWTIDGQSRECAYVAGDGNDRPALLCAGVTLVERNTDEHVDTRAGEQDDTAGD